MIFEGVWRHDRSKLVVLRTEFWLNHTSYKESCSDPLLEDLKQKTPRKRPMLYQDNASCHAAHSIQTFLAENCSCYVPKQSIPSNSPDLNSLGYCVWCALKFALNNHKIVKNYDQLKKCLIKERNALPQELISASIISWRSPV